MKHCTQPFKWFFATLLFSILISVSPNPSAADSLEDARDAFKQKDYKTAIEKFKPFAEQGNDEAQFFLGEMYYAGKGVPQDYAEAVKWWQKAAEQNLVIAQYNLGILYINGQGVQQNYDEGIRWVRKAADQGFAPAKRALESNSKK